MKGEKEINKIISTAFFYGVITASGIMSLFQDIMGKNGYIEYIQAHWIDSQISIPVTVVVLIFVVNKTARLGE